MRRRRATAVLEEKLGHLPVEVAAGTVLGIGIGAASFLREWGKPVPSAAVKRTNMDWISRTKRLTGI
ncbi:hypothetical protein D3C87_2170180 [compost metagenome]